MRTLVLVLSVAGGVLSLGALLWAALGARRSLRHLEGQKVAMQRAKADARAQGVDTSVLLRERGIPFASYADLSFLLQDTELAVVRGILSDLRGPALLGALGVILSTAASVWSLYLPAAG